jgi:hypothetical protein
MWLGPEGVAAVVGERTGKEPRAVVDETVAHLPVRRFTTAEEVADLVASSRAPAPRRSPAPRSASTAV